MNRRLPNKPEKGSVVIATALLVVGTLATGLLPVSDAVAAQKADMVRVVKSKKVPCVPSMSGAAMAESSAP